MAEGIWLAVAIIGVINCTTFIIAYQHKTGGEWRDYPMSRHMMGFIAALDVAFILIALSRLIGPLGPWPWIATLTGLNLLVAQRAWLLLTRKWWDDDPHKDGPTDNTFREYR